MSSAKTIRTSADLAINGAPPMFSEPVHVGRPNIGDRARFLERVNSLLDRRWLSNDGPLLKEFEQRIAAFLGVRHCVAMCNGTIALEIATRALDLKGEVIVPSYTFVATAHALQWQEITPIFADIDPGDPQSRSGRGAAHDHAPDDGHRRRAPLGPAGARRGTRGDRRRARAAADVRRVARLRLHARRPARSAISARARSSASTPPSSSTRSKAGPSSPTTTRWPRRCA